MTALSARLRDGEDELARQPAGSESSRIARFRLEALLGELDVASRRWAAIPLATDPVPDPTLDQLLRRLIHARLRSEEEIDRARYLLGQLRAGKSSAAGVDVEKRPFFGIQASEQSVSSEDHASVER
jgi:hypothetical protein